MTDLDPYLCQRYGLTANDRESYTIGEDDEFWHDILPMAFGQAYLVLTPKTAPRVWSWGWAFRSLPDAVSAFRAWDPSKVSEPSGYTRRYPAYTRRPVGDRDELDDALDDAMRGINPGREQQ